jgi:hypothetical protein
MSRSVAVSPCEADELKVDWYVPRASPFAACALRHARREADQQSGRRRPRGARATLPAAGGPARAADVGRRPEEDDGRMATSGRQRDCADLSLACWNAGRVNLIRLCTETKNPKGNGW